MVENLVFFVLNELSFFQKIGLLLFIAMFIETVKESIKIMKKDK